MARGPGPPGLKRHALTALVVAAALALQGCEPCDDFKGPGTWLLFVVLLGCATAAYFMAAYTSYYYYHFGREGGSLVLWTASMATLMAVLWWLYWKTPHDCAAAATVGGGSATQQGPGTSASVTWCGAVHAAEGCLDMADEFSDKYAETIAGEVFGPTGSMVTLGFEMTTWFTRMAVTKWVAPALCAEDSGEAHSAAGESVMDTMGHFIDNVKGGRIFTSTNPNTVDKNCVPYPHEQARFCAALGHSHRVAPEFHDLNFAALRDNNVELVWSKMGQVKIMKNLKDYSMLCENSVLDALCLDAFPMCNKADLTPCMMACRNTVQCFDEVVRKQSVPIQDEEKRRLQQYVEVCQHMCQHSVGFNVRMNVSAVAQTALKMADHGVHPPSVRLFESPGGAELPEARAMLAPAPAAAAALLGSCTLAAMALAMAAMALRRRWSAAQRDRSGLELLASA